MFGIPLWIITIIVIIFVTLGGGLYLARGDTTLPNNYMEIFNSELDREGYLYIKDGRIYDKDWKPKGYIKQNGAIYDNKWNRIGSITIPPLPPPKNLRIK